MRRVRRRRETIPNTDVINRIIEEYNDEQAASLRCQFHGYYAPIYQRTCESPIEVAFAMGWEAAQMLRGSTAMHSHSPLRAGNTGWCAEFDRVGADEWINPETTLEEFHRYSEIDILAGQVPIDGYRVDFVMQRILWLEGLEKYIPSRKVIVECDGHAFHERTKEQASRDKSRDRDLQAAGYSVLRFTGSEIWQGPLKCVQEVHDIQNNDLIRQFREMTGDMGESDGSPDGHHDQVQRIAS